MSYSMKFQQTQQAQIGTMRSQVHSPQQSCDASRTFTPAGPVFYSRNLVPLMSQTINSVAPQLTANVPVQSYSGQQSSESLCNISMHKILSSTSQVAAYKFPLN